MNDQVATSPTTSPTDVELMSQFCAETADSTSALEILYRRHNAALQRFLEARTGQFSPEDLSQDVWIKVQEKAAQFQSGSFRAWVFTIARNHLVDLIRRERGKNADYLETVTDDRQADPAETLLDTERMNILQNCLGKLGEQARRLVQLRLSGQKYRDICPELDLTESQAHKLYFEAKDQLTHCVEQSL